jgi:hypothetical protein
MPLKEMHSFGNYFVLLITLLPAFCACDMLTVS